MILSVIYILIASKYAFSALKLFPQLHDYKTNGALDISAAETSPVSRWTLYFSLVF